MTPLPIAMRETLCGLVCSFLATRVKIEASQVDIATKAVTPAVVDGVRRIANKVGGSSEDALLLVDLKNSFNLCIHAAFFSAVRNLFPDLLPWGEMVSVFYSWKMSSSFSEYYILTTPTQLSRKGFDIIRIVVGTPQEDQLSGLLFAVMLHTIALKVKEMLPPMDEEDTGEDILLLEL